MVRPGDELTLQVDLERLSRRGGWGRATASVDGAETCRARLLFAFAPIDPDRCVTACGFVARTTIRPPEPWRIDS